MQMRLFVIVNRSGLRDDHHLVNARIIGASWPSQERTISVSYQKAGVA
jgi:hypothetical protein